MKITTVSRNAPACVIRLQRATLPLNLLLLLGLLAPKRLTSTGSIRRSFLTARVLTALISVVLENAFSLAGSALVPFDLFECLDITDTPLLLPPTITTFNFCGRLSVAVQRGNACCLV